VCSIWRDFFVSFQRSLSPNSPPADSGDEQPHIVLLTPGPYNETYFEHAYLARYLGFPLVEGQDLTVRDDSVYLKTLRGLQARACDPAPPGRRSIAIRSSCATIPRSACRPL
jgi:uncharacterized circularly permuted ATP-grasp superfamily protein